MQSRAGVTSAMLPLHDCDSLTSGAHPSRLESSSCNLQPADIYSFGEGNAASYRVPCIFYLLMNILKWWVKFKITILDPPVSSPPPGPDHAFPRGLRGRRRLGLPFYSLSLISWVTFLNYRGEMEREGPVIPGVHWPLLPVLNTYLFIYGCAMACGI